MSTTPMSIAQFGQTIKAKHPEYGDMADDELGQKVLAKYPQYKDMVSTGPSMPSPNPQGLANIALRGTGIQVGAQPNPTKDVVQVPSVVKRMMVAAGASGASAIESIPMISTVQGMPSMLPDPQSPVDMAKGVGQLVTDPLKRGIVEGDIAGAIGEGSVKLPLAYGAISGGVKGVKALAGAVPGIKTAIPSVEELTSTTPKRIAELKSFPDKVESVRQSAVTAEKQAHKAASDAFPKFEQPIEVGKTTELQPTGAYDDFGPVMNKVEKPVTATFRELQEQRSNLLKDITNEKRAVARGAAPRFDLADMYQNLNKLDETMNKAALDQGGQAGLDQLQAARQQFGKYMNDFHSQGSPVKGLLDAKPGETQKVIGHFLSPDKGARAIETLKQYGVDTSQIQNMLGQGDRPLRVATAESAKLRKAGTPEAYTIQRLRESISQAKFNEMPSSAQARIPAKNMSNTAPPLVKNIPIIGKKLTPRAVTTKILESALKKKSGR